MTTATEQALSTTTIDRGVLPTTEVIARMHRIQEVMKAVMKEGTHYGTIPGTPKPTLYKPGAEKLLVTFKIAAAPSLIEDLSPSDEVRYRITVRGTNQQTGEIVGEMVGECSSNEEKYKWRAPVCDEEWLETDSAYRREKWKKGYQNNPASKLKQVRTSPADVANTILKMAVKRGLVALTLVVLGASDIFAQDLEDLADELRDSVAADDAPKAETKQPQRKSETAAPKTTSSLPADAKFVVGVIGKTFADKKPFAVYIGQQKFTTFDDKLWADVMAFAGTSHRVKLAFTETTKEGRTYLNLAGIAIADEAPAAAKPAAAAGDLKDSDIFAGAGREAGEEG